LGVELPLRALFEAPVLSALARRIDLAPRSTRAALTAQPRPPQVPLSFAQQRLWFLDQLEPGSAAYHVPHALELEGTLEPSRLQAALEQLARRHELLRTSFPVDEHGLPWQRLHPDALPRLEPLSSGEAGVEETIQRFAQRPFQLAEAPPWRAGLLPQG